MPINDLIQLRKGTSSQWTSTNPILASGEPGYDVTGKVLKIGDGVTVWNSLSGISFSAGGSNYDPANVNITGGAINGTSIGLSTAGTGNFSSLKVNNTGVSLSGHIHSTGDITGLYSAITGSISTSLSGVSGIQLSYNSSTDTLFIGTTGLQPSGNYAASVHTHTSSNITDFNSSVSGLVNGIYAPLSGASFSGAISSTSGNFNALTVTGIPVSISGHSHVSSQITDFGSSVTGLLPVKNVLGSGYINVVSSTGTFTVSVTGLQPSGNYAASVHTHTSSNITDFNSSVSGLVNGIYAPLSGASFSGAISSTSGNFNALTVTGIPVSINGHSHLSTDISDSTTVGRALLTSANATAQRTSLGLGTIATYNSGDYSLISHSLSIGSGNNNIAISYPATGVLNIVGSGGTSLIYDNILKLLTIASSGTSSVSSGPVSSVGSDLFLWSNFR